MKKILLVGFFSCMFLGVYAQNEHRERSETKDRIEALRVGYITKELQLTPQESEKFWPIYNAYREEAENRKRSFRRNRQPDNMKDSEINEMITEYFDNEHAILDIEEKAYRELIPIIGARRVIRLKKTESKFRSKVVQRAGKHMEKRKERLRGFDK